jgi:hypothetical protein
MAQLKGNSRVGKKAASAGRATAGNASRRSGGETELKSASGGKLTSAAPMTARQRAQRGSRASAPGLRVDRAAARRLRGA